MPRKPISKPNTKSFEENYGKIDWKDKQEHNIEYTGVRQGPLSRMCLACGGEGGDSHGSECISCKGTGLVPLDVVSDTQ